VRSDFSPIVAALACWLAVVGALSISARQHSSAWIVLTLAATAVIHELIIRNCNVAENPITKFVGDVIFVCFTAVLFLTLLISV
jgi:hypothetical protein